MVKHSFHLTAEWEGLRNGKGDIETGNLKTEVSIPPEMDGPGIGTNPDEMLLGAAATCYLITLAAMLENSGIGKKMLSLESEGIVDVTNGVITYEKIIHKPYIELYEDADDRTVNTVHRLVEKAEQSCMISRALKGNVEVAAEAQVTK